MTNPSVSVVEPSGADEPGPEPLAGFSVGVTAARRAEELGNLLERRGATVLHAPAIRIVPLADDTELLAAIRAVVAEPPDVVVASTGIGFRGWVEAADAWGLTEPLLDALRSATVLTRGPKAKGAVRAAGITEAWSPPSESSTEVLDHLLTDGVDGKRIAVQLHGEPLPDFCAALELAGADVVTVPVYRWVGPVDTAPLDRMVDAVITRALDAVTFTSAPAAASLLAHADAGGCGELMVGALRHDVLAMCVGPVTAGPLEARDIPTVWPARARIGAMVRRLAEELPARARSLPVAGHTVELRGRAVVLDGELKPLAPASIALLRELARRPGEVVSRARLLTALPGGGDDEHAVEMAVARLRSSLGVSGLVQTIVKRGYRLALEPGDCDG
ncbi:MAG: uroporphyrinogen-III synthase [Streptosporangiales bacterium]|nr:uroporphyrinogen-III synthase [Streptosporangiales bacterium]